MRHQRAFYFERADTITGTFDNIVRTAYKPEITVFIFPGNVTGVVDTVMPSFASTFRITIVLFEETDGFTFAGADYDLSLFSGFNGTTFVVYQVNVILRIRQSHASRFRFHPWHRGDGQCCFSLPETFH